MTDRPFEELAFWLRPDFSQGVPFWMVPPLPPESRWGGKTFDEITIDIIQMIDRDGTLTIGPQDEPYLSILNMWGVSVRQWLGQWYPAIADSLTSDQPVRTERP